MPIKGITAPKAAPPATIEVDTQKLCNLISAALSANYFANKRAYELCASLGYSTTNDLLRCLSLRSPWPVAGPDIDDDPYWDMD